MVSNNNTTNNNNSELEYNNETNHTSMRPSTSDDSIVLKPSIKPLILSIVLGVISIILVILIGLILSVIFDNFTILTAIGSISAYLIFVSVFGIIFGIIDLYVTTYTITNKNELIISKEFISKTSKVYRIDQITSLERTQSIIQKVFNLHSVEFNIFGGVGVQNTGQSNNRQPILPIFKNIEEGDLIFKEISSKMNLSYNQIQYREKPNLKPQLVSLFINLSLTIIALLGLLITSIFYSSTSTIIAVQIILFLFVIFYSTLSISKIINLLKLKKMDFKLYEQSAHISYSYFFKNSHKLVPYKKITNSSQYIKLIPYLLFKTSDCVIYTGGNKDPRFNYISQNSILIQIISHLVKDSKNILNLEKIQTIRSQIAKEKPSFVLKPGLSYIVQPLIPISFFIKIFILYLFVEIPIIENSIIGEFRTIIIILSSLYIFFYLIFMIYRLIMWNNFKYELYYDKLILQQGVLNIAKTEIYISNIKYISLYRPLYLQRIFKEGTIIIYTAGKQSHDGILKRIRESEYFYEELSKAITHKEEK